MCMYVHHSMGGVSKGGVAWRVKKRGEGQREREKTSSERTTDDDVDGTVWPEGAWTPYLFKFSVYIIDARVRWI